MKVKVWHCYWYGPNETIVMLAESSDALKDKVRDAIAAGWYPEDDGPMPDDWDDLMEAYEELDGGCYYFSGWDCEEIDTNLCEKLENN